MRKVLARRRCDDQGGWSLIELLVVMMLFAGILGIVFKVLIAVEKQTVDGVARAESVQQAKLGMAQIDRQVRSGNVVIDPAAAGELPRSLRVYTQTNGVHKCVQWQVYNETLRFRSWDPVGGGSAVDDWSIVARDVIDNGTQPVPFVRVASAGGSQAQSVRVILWLKAGSSNRKPVEISTVLFGRNTVYGYPADLCANVPAP